MKIAVFLSFLALASAQAQRLAPMADTGANLPAQKIGANDLLAVSVYDAPELTRTVRVGADGMIRLPMLKQRLKAEGLMPVEVEAELYRANAIENYDTACVRVRTGEDVELLFLASHASSGDKGPIVRFEFEKAVVRCDSRTSGLWAEFPDGTRKDYGVPDAEPMNKLWRTIAGVRDGTPPPCGLEAAASQTLCMNGMQDSMPDIRDFPAGMVRTIEGPGSRRLAVETPGAARRVVEGLDEALENCYEAGRLPSEMGVPWSAKGAAIDLRGYASFPSR